MINRKHKDGRIRNQAVSLTVYKHEHLETVLIPHFERFPLFAKKGNDFDWWKKGVRLICEVTKHGRHRCGTSGQWGRSRIWEPIDIEEFKLYYDAIRNARSQNVKVSMCDTTQPHLVVDDDLPFESEEESATG